MRYIKLFENFDTNNELPEYLYHLTSFKNYQKIKDEGLNPKRSEQGYGDSIYLTDEIHVAENYAPFYEMGEELVILKIPTNKLDKEAFSPDDYELKDFLRTPWKDDDRIEEYDNWHEVPWKLSLEWVNQVKYNKPISPENIEILKKFTF